MSQDRDNFKQRLSAVSSLLTLEVPIDCGATIQLLFQAARSVQSIDTTSSDGFSDMVKSVATVLLHRQVANLTKRLKEPACDIRLHFELSVLAASLTVAVAFFQHCEAAICEILDFATKPLLQYPEQHCTSRSDMEESDEDRKCSSKRKPYDDTAFECFLQYVVAVAKLLLGRYLDISLNAEGIPILTELFVLLKSRAQSVLPTLNESTVCLRRTVMLLLICTLQLDSKQHDLMYTPDERTDMLL